MSAEPVPASVWPLIGPSQPGDIWRTSARLTGALPVADTLDRLFQSASELSMKFDCEVRIDIEPDGDACDTGHFVNVIVIGHQLGGDLSPWPSCHGGRIPWDLELELLSAGWRIDETKMLELDQDMVTTRSAVHMIPTLQGVIGAPSSPSFESAIYQGVTSVLAPGHDRWFISIDVWLSSSSELADGDDPFDRIWAVDVGSLLPAGSWERAIWPSESEAGILACRAGMHQYHEPPCFPAP